MPLYILIPMMMLLFSLPASSVTCDTSTERQISQIKELLTKDPLVLANNALQSRHVVFLGVAGYSVTIPGIDTEKCNIEKYPVYIIPGTTDVMCSDEHRQLIIDAKSLAEKYNSVILSGLEKQSLLKCSGNKASNK